MIRTTYDAIVVGARCAGAPTAMLLARAGARVLLVDRASFPSDTISGHAIKPAGAANLQRWGLLGRVLETGCPPIESVEISVAGRPVALPPPPPETLPFLAPRRTVLDLALVEAAAAAGAEVHERTAIAAVLREGDQVLGIESRNVNGSALRAFAPIVIGADGRHSVVAQQVGAAYVTYSPPVSFAYFGYWSGCQVRHLALHFGPARVAGLIPTNDGQTLAFVQRRWADRHVFRRDAMASYIETLVSFDPIAVALDGARFDGPLRGMLDLPAYFRLSCGPGWALAGDAAHHKDPLVARGITDAFRDAELLAEAVRSGLGGETDLLFALARYQLRREQTSREVSALNHHLAELPDDAAETERRLFALLQAEAAADADTAEAIFEEGSAVGVP